MNRIKKTISIILIVAGVALLGSQAYLYLHDKESVNKENQSFVLQDELTQEETDGNENALAGHSKTTSKQRKEQPFVLNWSAIKNENADVIAWIRIPGTNVNYPILRDTDEEKYLRHNLYGNYTRCGSIFTSEINKHPFSDFNTIIYGHNLNNGLMFSDLKKYAQTNFYNHHKTIYVFFPDESVKKYRVVAMRTAYDGDSEVYNTYGTSFYSYEAAVNNGNKIADAEIYTAKQIKSMITLSTCTNTSKDKRYIVFAVEV